MTGQGVKTVPKEVTFTRTAIRQIAGLAPGERDAARAALARYAADPASLAGRVDVLSGLPVARLAVGVLRLVLVEGEERIVVLKLGRSESEDGFVLLRDIATGREERVSEATLDRLLAGANPVKVWREHRGLTQTVLARRAGINADYLSKIETGRRHASDEVMSDLLRALEIDALDFGLLVETPGRKRKGR